MFATLLALVLAAAPLAPEDYATMPTISAPQLSPDGRRVAYVVTRADMERSAYDSDVWVVDADGRNQLQLTRASGVDARPRWSPDGRRIAFLSDRDGRNAIWLLDVAGGEPARLTGEPTAVRDFEWSPDGKSIAFLRFDAPTADEERRVREKDDARVIGANPRHVHLYVIDVETKGVRRITSGAFSILSFSWSPDGKRIAFDRGPGIGLDDYYRTDVWLADVERAEIRPLVVQPGIDRGPLFSPDGKSIAFYSAGGIHDWLVEHHVHVVPADGGTPRRVSAAYGRTPDHMAWSDDGRTLWFDGPLDTTSQLFRVGADGSAFANVSSFAGMVTDSDVVRGRAAFVMQSLTAPPELFVTELAKFAPRQLTHHNDAYRDRALGETRLIRWKNPKDGLEIEGLLTLPVGYKSGARVPLLTFVHGGPASRFDQAFLGYLGTLYVPQALAARGYAVLRPNPRGTGGYGEAFRQANRNDWGGMDWIDINAGIDSVIESGIADPKRLGMMGWSYGGFIATWAIGKSGRFRAISIGAPVVDLLSFHGTSDIRDFVPHYFDKPSGEPPIGELSEMRHAPLSLELLRAHSPLWHLRPVRVPVLIQHGEADDRVPLSQGTMLYRILDELGVDVTMVVYPRTPHTPREPRLRIDVARRNIDFFVKSIAPDRP